MSTQNQSIRTLQSMLQQIAKQMPGTPSPRPTGFYDDQTRLSVLHFQRLHGLPATGVTDLATWQAITAAFQPLANLDVPLTPPLLNVGETIPPGTNRAVVSTLQAQLLALSAIYANLPTLTVTGIVDTETIAAIQAFQLLAGLPVTDAFDSVTSSYLTALSRIQLRSDA